jgi:hypothetical protein
MTRYIDGNVQPSLGDLVTYSVIVYSVLSLAPPCGMKVLYICRLKGVPFLSDLSALGTSHGRVPGPVTSSIPHTPAISSRSSVTSEHPAFSFSVHSYQSCYYACAALTASALLIA